MGHIRVRAASIIIKNDAILMVEFDDENGLHYNLPGGGVEQGESVRDAVIREAKEEADVDVEVGPLAFVYEYVPLRDNFKYGERYNLTLFFECQLLKGTIAKMPEKGDDHQTGVRWVPFENLDGIVLYPKMKKQLVEFVKSRNMEFIEESQLDQ
ncbi:NUDIX domain-containing protein [Sutcliffiella halmapala]